MGLQGLEVYYPENSAALEACYEKLAKKHHLLMTGGTDFHGGLMPHIQMGIGTGSFHVPYHLYEMLLDRLRYQANRCGI